jgi:cysteinyl-tRNA synthetase
VGGGVFPGWHSDCSALATTYLGRFCDRPGGGEDHLSVHHPQELAPTEACHGTRLANFWRHGSLLQLDDAKRAQSAGDFFRLQTVVERGDDPRAYRLFCLSAHDRATLHCTWEGLDGAVTALHRLRPAASEWGSPGTVDVGDVDRFRAQVNDDLQMPRAVALTWELVKREVPAAPQQATLWPCDRVFGWRLAEWPPMAAVVPEAIGVLVQQRQHARAERRWQDADALREQVKAAGDDSDDTPQGPRLRSRRARLDQ